MIKLLSKASLEKNLTSTSESWFSFSRHGFTCVWRAL
jgi:hypothetical protein